MASKNNQARDQNIETNNKYEALEEEKDEDEVIASGVKDITSIDKQQAISMLPCSEKGNFGDNMGREEALSPKIHTLSQQEKQQK
ncbi:hypothetical protein H5410_014103 [Solanum commersonii]|uniref:Uncharacterized protein n=1 Tax=Solanum commersonii TaxID=4109 RepID=A0A9J5ZQG3_SOLCO|nr:hypothetical protein H5410_014103 [Solanum commersonii]